jgi:hypothetical protein
MVTAAQARWLARITDDPLIVTRTPEFKDRYSLASGKTVPERTAKLLIARGWVVPEGDGLWGDQTQTYRCAQP